MLSIKLNDLITGTVVTMDEWIQNEIYRLKNNVKPRHCQNYSELADMLQEDPCRFQHNEQAVTPPPAWLCQVFIELMRYCVQEHSALHAPRLLLAEFDQLRIDVNLGKPIDLRQVRERLWSILFGQVQLTEHLVKVWKLMCEWVTQPSLHNHQLASRWLDLSLRAYLIAALTHHRLLTHSVK
ncbi:MAG: hypothetical protein EXX96DRAFT_365830 [Benjaminiella poitrasii]|nr:MAG: hypothetical protein EXX96DRAFT_365830 [Benjaminiella poitrasii]